MFRYDFYCINRLYFEVTDCDHRVKCTFFDGDEELYSSELGKGEWMATPSRKYIGNYFVEVRRLDGVLIDRISFLNHLKGKRVFIAFGSSSLGDTIAWIPYCLEFKKKYQCDVIVSTFKNFLFKDVYPELEFVEPGTTVHNIVAMPDLGWHWDNTKEPVNPVTIPLQQSACNILHLPYREIRPRITYTKNHKISGKFVGISTKSTSECKHWDKWPELIQRLKDQGYRVLELSHEANDYGAEQLEDTSLQNVMDYLDVCDFYIGLSSGISWLAWAMNVKVVMIANFTEANHEFECIRVENRKVCNGCWNNPKFRFDKGNWNWCPVHEDTPQQFECHRTIIVSDVVNKIKESGLWQ